MKIYVSHSRDFDFENELYEPLKSAPLSNYTFFLPHENGKDIDTKKEIGNSEWILAEVSYPSTGQGIELGWASMLNKKILCISKEGVKTSGSLKYITKNFLTYTDSADLVSKLVDFLSK